MNNYKYKISIIVACDINGGIGKNNTIPWHLPNDLKHFKKITINNAVVMGNNTWKSIGKPLSNRINVIVSHTKYESYDNVIFVQSLYDAFNELIKYNMETVYVIGGEQIYNEIINKYNYDSIYVTIVKEKYDCDKFFPLDFILNKHKNRETIMEDTNAIYYKL
jgi:dihydrofolate reductase